jgi:RHS repeat-associated protein
MFRCFDPDDPYGNGGAQAFGYDPLFRLSSLTVDLAGTASDLTKTFAYNPANQIISETRSNDAYAQVLANSTQTSVTNGLNQLATVNGTAAAYDARGNMTTDPVTGKTSTYYGSNNQLYTNPSPYTVFGYDALDRLWYFNTGAPVTNYVSDGTDQIAEYDGSNVLQKRYAFDGNGNPLVAYDASGNRTWMLSDERGSVVALANDNATMTNIDSYDEYGIPSAANAGTFQYAGMMWLAGPGLYAPTFRAYAQHLGRFNQTDPIGVAGGISLYGYTGGDPVNGTDPLGLAFEGGAGAQTAIECVGGTVCPTITVTGTELPVPALDEFVGLISSVSGLAAILATDMRRDAGGAKGQKLQNTCVGKGRGLKGNPKLAGKQGGIPGQTVRIGSAAIIPQQFGFSSGAALAPQASQISGTIGTAQFSGVTDVIGGKSPVPGVNVRQYLQGRFPGQLIIEVPGASDQGANAPVEINVPPGVSCPTGTVAAGG